MNPLTLLAHGDDEAEAKFAVNKYVDGNGTTPLLEIGAGSDLDWGVVTVSLADAALLRDWLTRALSQSAFFDAMQDLATRPLIPNTNEDRPPSGE